MRLHSAGEMSERHQVELPRPVDALRVAVDVVGDAVVADERAWRSSQRDDSSWRPSRFERSDERLAVRARRVRPAPTSRRTRRQQDDRPPAGATARPGRGTPARSARSCDSRARPRVRRRTRVRRRGRRRSSVSGNSGLRSSGGTSHRARRVADAEEARQPPALGLVAVHRERLEVPSARDARRDRCSRRASARSRYRRGRRRSGACTGIVGCRQLGGCQAR